MYDNYIFDLYGTLVDIHTNENKRSLWKNTAQYLTLQGASYSASELKKAYGTQIELLRTEQFTLTEKKTPFPSEKQEIEIDIATVFRRLYETKGITPTKEMAEHLALFFRATSLEYIRLYDGAKELLSELHAKNKKIYLLSNAQRLFTVPELYALGLYDLFDAVFISSDIGFCKPSSLFYDALTNAFALDKSRSVMIGNDWQADAWGAHKYGLASMYVHTAQSPALTGELPPDCRILSCISDVL